MLLTLKIQDRPFIMQFIIIPIGYNIVINILNLTKKFYENDQMGKYQAPQIRVCNFKLFSYFSTKTYVMSTQKNRLNETVLLSTQNTCFNDG